MIRGPHLGSVIVGAFVGMLAMAAALSTPIPEQHLPEAKPLKDCKPTNPIQPRKIPKEKQ